MTGLGEIAALGAALMWSISSLIFGGTRLSAWALNFAKNAIGMIVVFSALVLWAAINGTSLLPVPLSAIGYLAVSGVVGLTVGDTLFFRSLQILGPRRALVMATTTPVFGALLGWIILGEPLFPLTLAGILICIGGVSVVVMERRAKREAPGLYPGRLRVGVMMGLAAAFCQAAGLAISKIAMESCTPLEATLFRLLVAVLAAALVMLAGRQLLATLRSICQPKILMRVIPASVIGTFLGVWFSQIGVKHTSMAIATTLLSTSPLFAIPLIWLVHGHRVSWRAATANLVAIAGVFLVVARSWQDLLALLAGRG